MKLKIVLFLVLLEIVTPQTFAAEKTGFIPFPKAEQHQTSDSLANTFLSQKAKLPNGALSCFDHYRFNSVWVDASPTFNSVAGGTVLPFSGQIKNSNSYPIVDGSVYVRIYRRQSDETKQSQNGDNVVDQFFAGDQLSMAASSTVPINFLWKVPGATLSGDYYATYYVTAGKQFSLLGFTFLDNVTAGFFPFTVVGTQKNGVYFDKNSITLNEKPNNFTGRNLSFSSAEAVNVKIKLQNTTTQSVSVPVHWKLFLQDGLRESDKISEETKTVSLSAGESKELTYSISDISHPVYYLTAETDFKDSKSLVNIRFTREGIAETRIHFPAVADYPLQQGKSNTLFACLFDSGMNDGYKTSKLVLSVTDDQGKLIDQYRYTGNTANGIVGVTHDFVPRRTVDTFTVNAKLYREDGSIEDEANMNYRCKELGMNCVKSSLIPFLGNSSSLPYQILYVGIFILFFIVIIFIPFYLYQKGKKNQALLIFGILFAGTLLNPVHASAMQEDSFTASPDGYPTTFWWSLDKNNYDPSSVMLAGAKWTTTMPQQNYAVFYRASVDTSPDYPASVLLFQLIACGGNKACFGLFMANAGYTQMISGNGYSNQALTAPAAGTGHVVKYVFTIISFGGTPNIVGNVFEQVSFIVNPPAPPVSENGTCGTAENDYATYATDFSGTMCDHGDGTTNPSTVVFPPKGSSVGWTCNGKNGGSSSRVCTASHHSSNLGCNNTSTKIIGYTSEYSTSTPSTNGICGDATTLYKFDDPDFSGSFCSEGDVDSIPVFPLPGHEVTWKCVGDNGGYSSSCKAVVDVACGTSKNTPKIIEPKTLLCGYGQLTTPPVKTVTPSTYIKPATPSMWGWTCGCETICNAPKPLLKIKEN